MKAPTMPEVFRLLMTRFADGIHVGLPVRVEAYDATTQKASVQPEVKKGFIDEKGARQVERLPVIPNVPVQFPSGGGYRITFPIQPGDTGLLLFSDVSLDVWLAEGGEVDPRDDRKFNLSDGVFLPGVRSFAKAISDASADHMTLGKEGGLQIHLDGNTISIGTDVGAQLEAAALGETIASYLNALSLWFTAVSAWGALVTPPLPDLPPIPPLSFVSTSIKVKK